MNDGCKYEDSEEIRKAIYHYYPKSCSGIELSIAVYPSMWFWIYGLTFMVPPYLCTISVNVNNGNSWKQGNKHGSNGSSKKLIV